MYMQDRGYSKLITADLQFLGGTWLIDWLVVKWTALYIIIDKLYLQQGESMTDVRTLPDSTCVDNIRVIYGVTVSRLVHS